MRSANRMDAFSLLQTINLAAHKREEDSMTEIQFDDLVVCVLEYLSDDCHQHPEKYRKSGEDFEPCVKEAVDYAINALGHNATVDYTPGGHGFPDIVIEGADGSKFGIEVKSSTGTGNTWKINGNSVLGSTRVPGILKNIIVFGKMRGENSLFRAKEYEKCISNVVVTHSPRYLIDLDIEDGNSFFDKSNLSYDEISLSEQPIKLITDYFLSIGQQAWWLAESTPAAIQMFGKLPRIEQNKLMGYAFAHYTEIFSNSGTKFYRYMSWLASQNSVIDPALRDRFTAGGKADVELENVVYEKLPRIFKNLHDFRRYVIFELENADLQILEEDWGIVPHADAGQRIGQWLDLVTAVLPDKDLENVHKRQMVEDILLDEE